MSTRSRIAIENQDETIISIYCHFDGYINGVGKLLKEYYTTQAKVEALIELGDISALGMTPSSTIAYHRDRGEDLNSTKYNNISELFENGFESGVEYIYCLTKFNTWLVKNIETNTIDSLELKVKEIEA